MDSTRSNSSWGAEGRFPQTQWPELQAYRDGDTVERHAIMNSLAERYWQPVFAWLHRRGHSVDVAFDLTQSFFCDIVLERDLALRVDQGKGRFRTFLLNALKAHVVDEHRRQWAEKRRPQGRAVSIDTEEVVQVSAAARSPDEAFHHAWALNLLYRVIHDLREAYRHDGRPTHWEVFREKVLDPILEGCTAPPYETLCDKYDIPNAAQAAAMTTTVKRRFHSFLRDAIRPHVEAESDIHDEIAELLNIFSKPSARSSTAPRI